MKKTFSFSGLNKAGIAKRLAVAALALFAASNCFGQNLASQSGAAWKFLLAGTGKGNAELGENLIKINTTNEGNLEYSIQLVQAKIALEKDAAYRLSFDAYADQARTMIVDVSSPNHNYVRFFDDETIDLSTSKKNYSFTFVNKKFNDKNGRIEFNLGKQKSTAAVYISNVVLEKVSLSADELNKLAKADSALLKNGDFNSGKKGFEVNIIGASADYEIDKTSGDPCIRYDIQNTGSTDWGLQLLQKGVTLEKGKEYTLSLKAKSTLPRQIMFTIQRDGSADNNYQPYAPTQFVDLTANYQTFTVTFTMDSNTDSNAIFCLQMGAISGAQITKAHSIYIDSVSLTKK